MLYQQKGLKNSNKLRSFTCLWKFGYWKGHYYKSSFESAYFVKVSLYDWSGVLINNFVVNNFNILPLYVFTNVINYNHFYDEFSRFKHFQP